MEACRRHASERLIREFPESSKAVSFAKLRAAAASLTRERGGFIWLWHEHTRLNFPQPGCDQAEHREGVERRLRTDRAPKDIIMKAVRPENADPIPLRSRPPSVGTIVLRFVGLMLIVM